MKAQTYEIELPSSGAILSLGYYGENLLSEPPEARKFIEAIVSKMVGVERDGFPVVKRRAKKART